MCFEGHKEYAIICRGNASMMRNYATWTEGYLWLDWQQTVLNGKSQNTVDISLQASHCNELQMVYFVRNSDIVLFCSHAHTLRNIYSPLREHFHAFQRVQSCCWEQRVAQSVKIGCMKSAHFSSKTGVFFGTSRTFGKTWKTYQIYK